MSGTPFAEAHVLVVGDVMLDRWFIGKVGRISPEAPVPVVQVRDERESLGGAANVAANVVGLGARCTLIGAVGQDAAGDRLKALLEGIGVTAPLAVADRPTTTKARIIGDRQQVVRLDFEHSGPLRAEEEAALLEVVEAHLHGASAVIVSDYGKGVCTEAVCQGVISAARARGVPVLVDPKTTDWGRYRGATLVTPNFKEFNEVLGDPVPNEDAIIEGRTAGLIERHALAGVLVTRSEKGMTLAHPSLDGGHLHIHTEAREVFDVSGAGDTVIGTLGTALAAGRALPEAVRLANRAAGLVVARAGTVPIDYDTLAESFAPEGEGGVLPLDGLLKQLEEARARSQRVVFTNGCFDVLHRGHLTYLRKARALGDLLVVGLNSDDSVRRLKGPERPINCAADRALMLASLAFVDYVCVFEDDTPAALIEAVRPDTLVKGGDYTLEQVVGREHAGKVVLIDFVNGYSTTTLIERMTSGPRGGQPC